MDGGWRITSMPLYVDVHRINNELAELGIGADEPLTPDQLFPFDQFHYQGIDAVRAAAGIVGLGRQSRVLEVGLGLGGPARYLAHTVGCRVTALELQGELHDLASTLTHRCGLDSRVTHVRGDALTYPFPAGAFDAAVSWLAFHHIPRRSRLAARLAQAIRPGGRIYIEDLVVRAPFSEREAEEVRHTLYGVTMTGVREYEADLHGAGFVDLETTDMTGGWGRCTVRDALARSGTAANARHACTARRLPHVSRRSSQRWSGSSRLAASAASASRPGGPDARGQEGRARYAPSRVRVSAPLSTS